MIKSLTCETPITLVPFASQAQRLTVLIFSVTKMGSSLSKTDCLKHLEDNNFFLPDIAIEKTIKQYSVQDGAGSTGMNWPLPYAGPNPVGAVVLKGLIEKGSYKTNTKNIKVTDAADKFKVILGEENITKLRVICNSFWNYYGRYADNETNLMHELRILQRRLGEQLEEIKDALLVSCMTSAGLKIWINGAVYHIDLLYQLGKQGHETQKSIQKVREIYQENWKELLAEYKRYKKSTVEVKYWKITDHEQNKSVEVKNDLTVDDVMNYMFERDSQISEIENGL